MQAELAKALVDLCVDNVVSGLRVVTEVGEIEIPVGEVWIRDGVLYISVQAKL